MRLRGGASRGAHTLSPMGPVGDAPALACNASLQAPQRNFAARFDALAAETVPGLHRSTKDTPTVTCEH